MRVMINLFFAVVVALVIGWMFSLGLRGRNRWAGTIWLYLLLLLGSWALGTWMRPMGPPAWDVHWVPFVIAAATIALLIAAATPGKRRYVRTEDGKLARVDPNPPEPEEAEERAIETIGIFFWLLLGIAVLAILLDLIFVP